MDRSSIRAWRRIQKKRKWRNRLRLIYRAFTLVKIKDSNTGQFRDANSWKELRDEKWCQVYKTTGTPCSCAICAGEKYNRRVFKRESISHISEQLDC